MVTIANISATNKTKTLRAKNELLALIKKIEVIRKLFSKIQQIQLPVKKS